MSIETICGHQKLESTIVNMLDTVRRPTSVKIVSPIITNFKIRNEYFLKKIEKLLGCREGISIVVVTRKPIVRQQMGPEEIKQIKQRKEVIEKLEKDLAEIGNVKVHQASKRLHAKVILVENGGEKLFLLGSSNYTHNGIYKNIETNVCIKNEDEKLYDELDDYVTRICEDISRSSKSQKGNT